MFNFEVEVFDSDVDELEYTWDFGDDSPVTGDTATYTYVDNGTYSVILTVTDNEEATGTDTVEVTVLNVAPAVDAGGPYSARVDVAISFTSQVTDPGVNQVPDALVQWFSGVTEMVAAAKPGDVRPPC